MIESASVFVVLQLLWAAAGGARAAEEQLPLPRLLERVRPAVVLLMSLAKGGTPTPLGTGFFLTPDGVVVTNAHVIEGQQTLVAKRLDQAVHLVSKVLVVDTAHDLALLQAVAQDVPYLVIGKAAAAEVGEDVVAVGSPLGLEGSVSTGIISAKRNTENGLWMLQTTAPISPGSSGGPLLTRYGTVIGVTSAFLPDGQNVNLAVPAEFVTSLLVQWQRAQVNAPPQPTPTAPTELGIWRSLSGTNDRFKVSRAGGRIYTERQFSRQRPSGDFERCELAEGKDGYSGTCYGSTNIRCGNSARTCTFSFKLWAVGLGACRMQGLAQVPRSVDCSCQVKYRDPAPYVWLCQ